MNETKAKNLKYLVHDLIKIENDITKLNNIVLMRMQTILALVINDKDHLTCKEKIDITLKYCIDEEILEETRELQLFLKPDGFLDQDKLYDYRKDKYRKVVYKMADANEKE